MTHTPPSEHDIHAYVDGHLEEPLPHKTLAEQVRLSDGHFARAFKRSFGLTPHAYVLERRIARAQAVMLESQMSLCEIAIACRSGMSMCCCRFASVPVPASIHRLNPSCCTR